MSKKTPVCDRGFLTAIKKFPQKSIQQVTQYANEVCAGRRPDLSGSKKISPYFSAKARAQSMSGSTVRPQYPQYEELFNSVKGKPIIVDQYIIGVMDIDGDLLLCRPKSMAKYMRDKIDDAM